MRKFFGRLLVALSTFALGLCFSYLMQTGSESSGIYYAVEVPEFCEVHGETLRPVPVEVACGVFRNRRGYFLAIPCPGGTNRKLSAEDALLPFHEFGGLSTLALWDELAKERQSSFPHGYGEYRRTCSSSFGLCEQRKVCAKCRAAELAWMKERSQYLRR